MEMEHMLRVQRRIRKAMGRPVPRVEILSIYKRLLGHEDAPFFRDLLIGDPEMEHYAEEARLDYEEELAEEARLDYEEELAEKRRERWRGL